MSKDPIYRTYQEGDEHGILELFKECFGHDLTLPFWEWKYKLAPGGGPRIAVAQESNGKIVAAYNIISVNGVILNEKGVMGQCVDIMVHPKHRGKLTKKGVLVKTFLHFCNTYKEEVKFLYGFPGKRHWILGQRTGIYEGGGPVAFYKKAPKKQKLATRIRYGFRLTEDLRTQLIDEVWKKNTHQFKTCVVRDGKYASWRFIKHPIWKYELYILFRRVKGPVGWCAVRQREKEILVVDFVVPSNAFSVLMEKVEEIAYLRCGSRVSIVIPQNSFWESVLLSRGYRKEVSDLHFTINTPFMGQENKEVDSFFYTMGDMDIV